jgi:hypothetical protein
LVFIFDGTLIRRLARGNKKPSPDLDELHIAPATGYRSDASSAPAE